MRRAAVAALLLVVALAGRAEAATDKWAREISGLEERLTKREWKDTLDRAVKLRQKMLDRIDEAEALVQPLAQSLALQALAEANLGRDDDALWHWQAAEAWLPGLDGKDLSSYGRAREVLALPPAAAAPAAPPPVGSGPRPSTSGAGRYQPEQIRQAVRPVFPASLAKSAKQGKVRGSASLSAPTAAPASRRFSPPGSSLRWPSRSWTPCSTGASTPPPAGSNRSRYSTKSTSAIPSTRGSPPRSAEVAVEV